MPAATEADGIGGHPNLALSSFVTSDVLAPSVIRMAADVVRMDRELARAAPDKDGCGCGDRIDGGGADEGEREHRVCRYTRCDSCLMVGDCTL